MNNIEFQKFPKIPRRTKGGDRTVITEKIDGTNGCIVIENKKIVAIQSRNQFITPVDDNFNFAAWVFENADDLVSLGDGHHYGEWAGPGIQKNPMKLDQKRFFLFNTFRWNPKNPNKPNCCDVVPVVFDGVMTKGVEHYLDDLVDARTLELPKDQAYEPEGIIEYNCASRLYIKHTVRDKNGKWINNV